MKSRYLPERTVAARRPAFFSSDDDHDSGRLYTFEPAGIADPKVLYADDTIELQPGRYLFRALDAEVAFMPASLGTTIPVDTSSRWIDCVILAPYTDLPVDVDVKTSFRVELEVDAICSIIRTADAP